MNARLCRVSSQWWSDLPELTHLEKACRQSDETWSDMPNWLPTMTPRLKTDPEKLTLAPNSCNSLTDSLSSCCNSNWVLSAFILSRLLLIHASIRSTHETKRCTVVDADMTGASVCRQHMSARLNRHYTSNSSARYKRNSNGPSTEPCGTPKVSIINVHRTSAYETCWASPWRNDWIRDSATPQMQKDCWSWSTSMSRSTQSNVVLRSKRPAFWHPGGQQRRRCLTKPAEVQALLISSPDHSQSAQGATQQGDTDTICSLYSTLQGAPAIYRK